MGAEFLTKGACVLCTGCPESRIDTARVENFLLKNGWKVISDFRKADLVIFRTCGLREASEKNSLDIIRRIKAEKRRDARLIVWGCLPKINPDALKSEYSGITFGEREIGVLNEILQANTPVQKVTANFLKPIFRFPQKGVNGLVGKIYNYTEDRLGVARLRSSMFHIKVATGCLGDCTFCAVRKSRGTICSRSIDTVLHEFRKGLERGYKHFGLLATDLGAYGRDQGHTLVDLLNEMIKETGDYHVGLRNVNPYFLNKMFEELIPVFSSGKISFLSSAVESGSNRILRLMQRKYTIEEFKRCIRVLNKEYPAILLRTQAMVGFPTETDKDFQKTVEALDELTFDWVEVYKFSRRKGTAAARMEDQVPQKIKEDRHRKLFIRSLLKNSYRKIGKIIRSYA